MSPPGIGFRGLGVHVLCPPRHTGTGTGVEMMLRTLLSLGTDWCHSACLAVYMCIGLTYYILQHAVGCARTHSCTLCVCALYCPPVPSVSCSSCSTRDESSKSPTTTIAMRCGHGTRCVCGGGGGTCKEGTCMEGWGWAMYRYMHNNAFPPECHLLSAC